MLDATDRALLALLQQDARQSHRQLAAAVGVSHPTVAARIARMEQLGIIRGYTAVLDEAAFGTDVTATVSVACHWCKRRTTDPVEKTISGRIHAFCCATCASQFIARDAQHRSALEGRASSPPRD